MEINADFSLPAVGHAAGMAWVPSPANGVDRRMLDRVGDEIARATSLVRFAPGCAFAAHVHGGGEEFLVLDGVFQDEHADYPAGSYVRNPPQSRHVPRSDEGCTLFVKLWQFDPADRLQVAINTEARAWVADPDRDSIECRVLHADDHEHVSLERWPANEEIELESADGIELLVLQGGFHTSDQQFARWSWLRLPCDDAVIVVTGAEGAQVWVKRGHLRKPHGLPAAYADQRPLSSTPMTIRTA